MIAAKLAAAIILGSSPFSLTIGPVKMAAQPGGAETVYVFDTGKTLPANVVMQFHEIERNAKGICRINPRPVTWASASPGTFTVKPGHYRVVHVKIADSGVKPGHHDLAIEATSIVTRSGNIRVNAILVTQALVTFPGQFPKNAPKPCVTLAVPKADPAFPIIWTVVGACALIFAILAGLIIRRQRHRGTRRLRKA